VGLTQADLAAKLDLDRTAITKLEAGTRAVSAQEIVALSAALGRSLDSFVHGDLPQLASRRESQREQGETRAAGARARSRWALPAAAGGFGRGAQQRQHPLEALLSQHGRE